MDKNMSQQPPQYGFQGQPAYGQPMPGQPMPGQPIQVQPGQTIIMPVPVGPNPCQVVCPSCRAHIMTKMDYETSSRTHCVALILCCFVCWPCAWLPYVMDSCKSANHYCPACNAYIGTYKN